MGNTKLTINLVTWNGAKYIPFLFESLAKQTDQNWDMVVIDNASSDGVVSVIRSHDELGDKIRLIQNASNVGFAGGHNQAFLESRSEYFLIINQDLYLNPDCIQKLVQFLDAHPTVVAVAPRTMKWNFAEQKFTNIIDSLGLRVFRNRRVVEIGEGREFTECDLSARSVFGVSGAIVMFRRAAIDELDYFLDGSLNSYKEDVDLSYLLNASGGDIFVLYDAVAYHDRTGFGAKHKDDISSAINKISQKPLVRYHSYKNHLIVLYKNEYWQNFTVDFLWILWYELKKFVYFLLFDHAVLVGIKEVWRDRVDIKNKRAQLVVKRKIDWRQMRVRMFGN